MNPNRATRKEQRKGPGASRSSPPGLVRVGSQTLRGGKPGGGDRTDPSQRKIDRPNRRVGCVRARARRMGRHSSAHFWRQREPRNPKSGVYVRWARGCLTPRARLFPGGEEFACLLACLLADDDETRRDRREGSLVARERWMGLAIWRETVEERRSDWMDGYDGFTESSMPL